MDLPDDVLCQADWVLASVHYGQRQSRQQITERLAVSLDIANLNNYIDDRIVDALGQTFPRRSEYYGMNIILGVRYDF